MICGMPYVLTKLFYRPREYLSTKIMLLKKISFFLFYKFTFHISLLHISRVWSGESGNFPVIMPRKMNTGKCRHIFWDVILVKWLLNKVKNCQNCRQFATVIFFFISGLLIIRVSYPKNCSIFGGVWVWYSECDHFCLIFLATLKELSLDGCIVYIHYSHYMYMKLAFYGFQYIIVGCYCNCPLIVVVIGKYSRATVPWWSWLMVTSLDDCVYW